MASHRQLEEGRDLTLDFKKLQKIAVSGAEVLPVAVQNVDNGEVLIIGYVNQLALKTALNRRVAVLWSTSRDEIWIKGATSGDFLELVEVRVNCEQNSLLYRVRPVGKGACHTKDANGASRPSCYYRRITPQGTLEFVANPSAQPMTPKGIKPGSDIEPWGAVH